MATATLEKKDIKKALSSAIASVEMEGYVFTDYHKKLHSTVKNDLEQLMNPMKLRKRREDSYYKTLEVITDWQHHVVRDDLLIFNFFKHKDFSLGDEIVGKMCDILSLENNPLGYGEIVSAGGDNIEINCRNKGVPVIFNDIVKVSVILDNRDCRYFVARVQEKSGTTLKLFKGSLIKTVNDREYFRIPVTLNASLSAERVNSSNVAILDISAGGLMIETTAILPLDSEFMIDFTLQDKRYTKKCKALRTFKKDTTYHIYGVKFVESSDDLVGSLLNLQLRNQLARR